MARVSKKISPETIFNSAKKKCYFDLTTSEKRLMDSFFREGRILCYSYILNPAFLKKIQPNLNNYILFIDARRADFYTDIKNYILSRKAQLNGFFTTGDSDFIISYSSTEAIHNTIKTDLMELLNLAPKEDSQDELILSFKITQPLMLKGEFCSVGYNKGEDVITFNDKVKIASTLCNYNSEKSIKKFTDKGKVKQFLTRLEKNDIIDGYYCITPPSQKLKAVVLVLYTQPGYYDKVVKEKKSISKYIIDLFEIQADKINSGFYTRANFAILGEFSSMAEYHKWKEEVYELSLGNSQKINFMTFIIEDVISEIPQTFGGLREFDDLCKLYNGSSQASIEIGHPFYYDEIEDSRMVKLKFENLKDHGMIIGYQGSGKTYTALELCKRFSFEGLKVHILDSTGGIQKKLNEDFPELIATGKVANLTIEKGNKVILNNSKDLSLYKIDEDEYCNLVENILSDINKIDDSTGRKTTDIIIFEEALKLFNNVKTLEKIMQVIKVAGRKGFSLWFSTQNFNHFPIVNGVYLVNDLKNRIIQKIEDTEAENIALFLCENDKSSLIPIREELKELTKGQALVSFYQNNTQLKPIKVAITKT